MKILVFENGELGRLDSIQGENVQAELEELLGGPIVWEELTSRLHLVTRSDADKEGLPASYGIYRSGRIETGVYGNAAVVKVGHGGGAQDMTREDAETARFVVRPLGQADY